MLELGLIGFAQPWLLAGLLALPALWWLLRLTPPPPKRVRFPAIALLAGLVAREESAARMPWWLLALRLLIAALVILALAEPVLAPQRFLQGSGPLVVVVDNGWGSAPDWDKRQNTLQTLLDEAAREDRAVTLLPTAATAEPPADASFRPAPAWQATAGALAPQAWGTDRAAVLNALSGINGPAEAFWLHDGLAGPDDAALAQRLQRLGSLTVVQSAAGPKLLDEPEANATGFELRARRTTAGAAETVTVEAVAGDGRVVAAEPIAFAADATEARIDWTLPRDLANQVRRLRLAQAPGVGGTVLLDDRWQRRTVGLVAAGSETIGHPLLDPDHYLGSALAEIAAMEAGTLAETLAKRPSLVITRQEILADTDGSQDLDAWLEGGGVLVRFAGPEMAASPDDFLPVRLRPVSRVLGGALSWDTPQPLAAFPETSPFAGLEVPDDVRVRQQVLAEPSIDLRDRTWASLADGTPLVTAVEQGKGYIVLIHVTANADWSNLPLSGLFVDMLARLVRLGQGSGAALDSDTALPPQEVLDGFGRLQPPPPGVLPLAPQADPATLGPQQPPGYYGALEGVRAWNLAPALATLEAAGEWPGGVTEKPYDAEQSRDIAPWLWLAAFALLLADFAASLALRGHGPRRRALAAVLVVAGLALATHLPANPAQAASEEELRHTLETHLAYVRTGDPAVDRASEQGLAGLSWVLADRTSIEPAEPVGVDVASAELAFYPLLYWPVTLTQPIPSSNTKERIARYLERGGAILFDTRDQFRAGSGGLTGATPEQERLRQILDGIRVPPLQPVPQDHVLTKSFYLLNEFPGRYAGGTVWVEANAAAARDGVSSVIIGSHDWAAAWALDQAGRPQYAVMPGGERQREFAYRFGVNLAMHILTGNYKGDQVHVPSILDRLSQ